MKVAGCRRLRLDPLTGHWFRALRLEHWEDRLRSDHTTTRRSRFSAGTREAPRYSILYLGENHQVAIYEVGALFGDPDAPVANPKGSWVLMSLSVRLHHVADLTDPDQQKLIATNYQELTGVWVNSPGTAPTQELGAALHAVPRLEGILYPSSKAGSRCLAIFMDKLGQRSLVEFPNELTGSRERLP
jgi:hypothetical protein